MVRTYLRLVLTAPLLVLAACGGGNGTYATSGSGGGTPAAVEGIWKGTYTIGAGSPVNIFAVIAKDGDAFFYDDIGTLYVLPSLTGKSMLTGKLTAYAPQTTTFASGLTVETFDVTAMVSSTSITGTFTGSFGGTSETGTFTLSPFAPFPGNPSIVAGNWGGFYVIDPSISTTTLVLHVLAGGVVTGTDANGCTLTGNIAQVQSEDLFTVTVDSTGGPLCAGILTGLAFESNGDLADLFGGITGTYYYLGVSNATAAFVAELKVQ